MMRFEQEKIVFDGDDMYRQITQDVDPVLKMNKYNRDNINFKSPYERIGRIPMALYREWIQKYELQYPPSPECVEKILVLLRKPEYKYLRTGGNI